MKRISILTTLIILLACLSSNAQAIWNRQHLNAVKTQLDRPMYAQAYNALISDANILLEAEPLSVMMKEKPSPTGDNHYYTSLARYFHPDPSKPDGMPYVSRDGITNPEINLWDRNHLGEMANRVTTLSLAYFFSGNEQYAAKAAEQLKVWFLNKDTRMYPNFEYAQMVPGVNSNKGRSFGVLDGYSFVEMLDGVALLANSKAWTKKDNRNLQRWMSSLLDWILTSDQGKEEATQANNHSTAYDAQAIAIALYVNRTDVARKIINEVPQKRIFTQIKPNGEQPHEMSRTLSYSYSQYNLTHLIDIFLMAQHLDIKIDNATDANGSNFYKALDFLASFLGKSVDQWPGKQINGWEQKQQDVARDLWRVATFIDSTRTNYIAAYQNHRIFNPAERFTLLYYTPDDVDDAFANASLSLQYAITRANAERHKQSNLSRQHVSPRTVNAQGTMTLTHPNDWTSGFFPGELWMMYDFTNNPYWRQQAATFTWLVEDAKTYRGTHDLGFMFGDSFGKAWELTGEQSYFDVVHQAAETLITRFNPTVGAIRSWDHNAQVWKYPVIIDNMMNLEMLFKMTNATGNSRFHDIAVSHANKTLKNHFRADNSSYHVVDYDPENGNVRMKVTAQGYADDSFWSRGQGWGLYGYTMCYRYTSDARYLNHASNIADFILSLPNLPSDFVPYWDMKAPGTDIKDNPEVVRDASAASLIASALYELATYVNADKATRYRNAADKIVASLSSPDYYNTPGKMEGFLLHHSTGHRLANSEVDVPLVYADYYYLEALLRKRNIEKYLHR